MNKERSTVYLDVDDDITAIIGKLSQAEHSQVALVVPKRSTVLQSVVNLKLVKKAAKEADKEPVLITEDPLTNKMAGGQQILAAPNLSTEPKIPEAEKIAQTALPSDVIEGEPLPGAEGSAAAAGAAPSAAKAQADKTTSAAPAVATTAAKTAKKRQVPNFDRFKKRFFLALGGLVGLVLLILTLFFWLPKATILVDGRTEPLAVAFNFTADSGVDNPQYNNNLLPAEQHKLEKTLTKTITPTGKKDVGTKATGSVTIKNCESDDTQSYSSGVKFVSSNGRTFLSDSSFSVPGAGVSGGNIVCGQSESVPVTAAANGDSYNVGPTSYTSPSLSGDYTITGTQMSGGTSKTITVVTQKDVDAAKNELVSNERATAKKELAQQFKEEIYVIESSYSESVAKVTSDPAVGQEADTGRVSLTVTYDQMGVRQEFLEELIKTEGRDKLGAANQDNLAVIEAGLKNAKFKLKDKVSATAYRFDVSAQTLLGPDIDFAELKERIAGKRYGETIEIVKTYPNVSGADVKFSPFWVRKVPANPDKVTIEIKLPDNQ